MPRRCSFKLELDYPQPLAGVDEAGCAPLAGPVVAAACILDRDRFPRGIDDFKNLPIDKREAIYAKLVKCSGWGVGIATVEEIDQINIYWARMLAMTGLSRRSDWNRPGCWSTAMPRRGGSVLRRRSSMATPSAVRLPPRRSSPRSLGTGSWRTMPSNIRATDGRGNTSTDKTTAIVAANCILTSRRRRHRPPPDEK